MRGSTLSPGDADGVPKLRRSLQFDAATLGEASPSNPVVPQPFGDNENPDSIFDDTVDTNPVAPDSIFDDPVDTNPVVPDSIFDDTVDTNPVVPDSVFDDKSPDMVDSPTEMMPDDADSPLDDIMETQLDEAVENGGGGDNSPVDVESDGGDNSPVDVVESGDGVYDPVDKQENHEDKNPKEYKTTQKHRDNSNRWHQKWKSKGVPRTSAMTKPKPMAKNKAKAKPKTSSSTTGRSSSSMSSTGREATLAHAKDKFISEWNAKSGLPASNDRRKMAIQAWMDSTVRSSLMAGRTGIQK